MKDPDSVNSMVIGLVRNDACAVYLNGNEVFRDGNLNDDASYSTLSFTDLLEEDYRIYVPLRRPSAGWQVLAANAAPSA